MNATNTNATKPATLMTIKRLRPSPMGNPFLRYQVCGHLPTGMYVDVPFASTAEARKWCEERGFACYGTIVG